MFNFATNFVYLKFSIFFVCVSVCVLYMEEVNVQHLLRKNVITEPNGLFGK